MKEQDYIVRQVFDIESLNYRIVDNKIEGLLELAFTKKLCFFVFDYFKHNYYYIKTFNDYLNDIPEKIAEPYLFFNKKIHPEDRILVKQIHHRAFAYAFEYEKANRNNLTLYYSCKMQNKKKVSDDGYFY